MAKPRILCIDDEQHVLDGISRVMRSHFDIVTAAGGGPGLQRLQDRPGYAVIMTDMRMPGINGAMVLKAAREQMPDATRLLLTGQADLKDAMSAINEGQIFRFIAKPCRPDELEVILRQAAEQHDLRIAQRQLLEETLTGSVQALIELLALAHPIAFGRANRVRQLMAAMGRLIGFRDLWQMEMAAMLSQIGVITLPGDLARRLYDGAKLTADEEIQVDRMPLQAQRVLAGIPRLDEIREILGSVSSDFMVAGRERADALPLGARMLRVILDYDRLTSEGATRTAALAELSTRHGRYDPAVLTDLATVLGGVVDQESYFELRLDQVRQGMTFVEDVRAADGTLLVARGQVATEALLERIQDFWLEIPLLSPVRVAAPAELQPS